MFSSWHRALRVSSAIATHREDECCQRGGAMSDEKTATKTILLSDGTAVEFRELTKSEWERMERIKFGGSLEKGARP